MKNPIFFFIFSSIFLFVACGKREQTGEQLLIDQLNRDAFAYRYRNIDSSKIISEKVLERIKTYDPNYWDGKARALNTLAYACFLTSDFDIARKYIDSVQHIPVNYANKEIEETISKTIEARLLLRECKYVEAFTIYDSLITIFNQAPSILKYNDFIPAKYDKGRYYWAKSEYLIGNAVLNYYYRNTDLTEIMKYLREAENDTRLHIDTTQLSILYYTFAGAYGESDHFDIEKLNESFDYIEKGLSVLSDPHSSNTYYVANNYQILGAILAEEKVQRWIAGNDTTRNKLNRIKEKYLVGKYGWTVDEVQSDTFVLLLYEKSDALFKECGDPYQVMASGFSIGNYYLQHNDTAKAKMYFYKCIEPGYPLLDFTIKWRKDVYEALLQTLAPEENTVDQAKEWFRIYSETSDMIAKNTKVDYKMQQENEKNKSDSKRSKYIAWIIVSILILTVIYLYHSIVQNKKLKEVQADLQLRNKELEDSQSDLEFVQQKLIEQKRMELLTYVVRGISHELSQPLGTMTQTLFNTSEVANMIKNDWKEMSGSEFETHVEDIISDLKIISQSKDIITDLIKSFRNIIKENIVDSETEFNLKQRIEDIVKIVRPSIRSNIELIIDCDEQMMVRSFPLLLGQVITNLLANANQHAFPNANAHNNVIRVICKKEAHDLIIQCVDNGIGIPENELEKLCQPFVTKTNTNLGLGLFLIKNIVEQYMNGKILFVSNKGLSVTIHIPNIIL